MKEKNREEVPMELKAQVERIKEILPDCTDREIYEALKVCKMDPDDAAQRLLSQVETEENREAVPMEGKEKVERIKKMVPRFAEELIWEVLKQCNMDSNLSIQRLLSQETGKNRERSPMERNEQFERIKAMVPRFTKEDREGVPMEWKEQVEHIKEMMACFTEEMIYEMLEQCYIDSDLTLPRLLSPETPSNSGSLLNNFSSPPSNAKSSIASQLHSVSFDKGKEVVRRTEDDAATTSRSNVRALRAKGPWNSHAVQAGSNPMALGHDVASSSRDDSGYNEALGSSEFLEYKIFPPPTQQYGISFTLSDLVANADQPSELQRLLRFPFLDTSSVPSRSSAAGSQHPQTSTSESGLSEATPSNLLRRSIQSTPRNALDLPSSRFHHAHSVSNAQSFTSSASIHQSLETPILGNNMSTGRGFTRPNIELSSNEPQCPLQQHGSMDEGDNMHQNFVYDMPSAQQEVHQGRSSSRANADVSGRGSFLGAGSTPHPYLTNSPTPSDISRTGYDSALHYQAQHQQRNDCRPAGMNYNNAVWNQLPGSGAKSALPEIQHGGFPGWAPLPAEANNQRGEGSSLQ
ncbi:uncharacterized protein LOC115685856 [Syzygium oleosum]|uniref:uncharacterized protein LOC115685856 n=1 Tax=Syzygium oleosum TaxID=219896 RepID=UPI0024B9E626|nr:uncharacterized protein LOC115685856 [Syzygium oleosum]